MTRRPVIAIDGPAGAGKSTVARALARELGYVYLDTGAMYRALALRAREEGVDVTDPAAVERLAERTEIRLEPGPEGTRVLLDGRDVTALLRTPEVSAVVSQVAGHPGVRRRLAALQREMARRGGMVIEGRDVTTVVAPDAEHKFYLTAGFGERVRRRYRELREAGHAVTLRRVREDIARRDRLDTSRSEGPLRRAPDAVVIDTTRRTADEVVALILAHCAARAAGAPRDGG